MTNADKNRTMVGKATIATAAAIVLVFAVAAFFVFRFIDEERGRALHQWQIRLGILADGRAAAVGNWLARQRSELSALSTNVSLRVYTNQILDPAEPAAAEAQYLRNLLTVTASRTGFTAPPRGPNVPANVRREGVAGLIIVGPNSRVLAATDHAPALAPRLRRFLSSAPADKLAMLDLYAGPGDRPTIAFATPVLPPQGGARIASVLAVKPVDRELYPLLKQPGVSIAGAEPVLVRRDGDIVTYLSPLADGTAPLKRRMATNSPSLTAALALAKPGAFVAGRDYRGVDVLATSRAIAETGWLLVYKIDRGAAMGPVDARLNRMLIILLLALTVALVGVAALWRHGASRRAAVAATRYRETADALAAQRDLMRAVVDNQPNAVFMTDGQGRLQFANKGTADLAGMSAADMPGKTLQAVFGADAARPYQRLALQAIEDCAPVREVRRIDAPDGDTRILQSVHVPVPLGEGTGPGILAIDEDITAAILEREKREKTLGALTQTILTLIDRRDPHAAHQSVRVARVAEGIAREMGLVATDVEAAGTAGSLSNIGKLLVPAELLTKPGALTAEELAQVREAIDRGPGLLSGIEFDAPIVAALEHVRERWDGKGPKGTAGDAIPLLARIVSLANAFVAMASPRAHRPASAIDDVCVALQAESGTVFDRRAVSALVNWLDNKDGRSRWRDDESGDDMPSSG